MKAVDSVLVLSLGAFLIVPTSAMSQEAEVRDELQRTFAALNAGQADGFLSYLMPRTQVFHGIALHELGVDGVGLPELGVEHWRGFFEAGYEFDLMPREIKSQIHGNTAVTTAYIHGTVRSPSGWVEGGPWRYSETRIRDQGEWKILQMHFSPLVHIVGQVADRGFDAAVVDPAYQVGTGPLVLIDEAHFNHHTAWHSYWPFAELLRRDGYVVTESATSFSREALESANVIVIANAMSQNVFASQQAPPLAAFSPQEVTAVRDWVDGGGSLLLIVDHNPYPASVEDLAGAFGIQFLNCGAQYPGATSGRLMFRRSEAPPGHDAVALGSDSVTHGPGGKIVDHPVTADIDSVMTFLGSAFRVDKPHSPLLVFGPGVECWGRTDLVAHVEGLLQGALLEVGKGRVAVFGEAGMFTAQLNVWASTRMGMNNPLAAQNPRLLLSVMHWLTTASSISANPDVVSRPNTAMNLTVGSAARRLMPGR